MGPGELGSYLRNLPVVIEDWSFVTDLLEVPGYAPPGRPTGELVLKGAAKQGRGESVAFDLQQQRRFPEQIGAVLPTGRVLLGELSLDDLDPHLGAALEGALIDLALVQAERDLGSLCAVSSRPLKAWYSFDAHPDPAVQAAAIRHRHPEARLKIDVSPDWTENAVARLAEVGGVAVLDFKQGAADQGPQLRHFFPDVLFEDGPELPGPRSADRPVLTPADARRLGEAGLAINLKAPRMGGFLAVLDALELCRVSGAPCYFGGMFEVGVGRRQARKLAALFAPDAWHDLAPLGTPTDPDRAPPLPIELDGPGF